MMFLAVGVLVFIGWLIGRRWLRIIVVCALFWFVGGAVVQGYQDAMAREGDVIQ